MKTAVARGPRRRARRRRVGNAGARVDEQRARAAAPPSLAAPAAGRRDPSGVQLRARDRGLLGGARRDGRLAARARRAPCRASIRFASRTPRRSRRTRSSAARSRRRSATPICRCPGYDGRAVTIALLDTGVDRMHPSLLGSSRGESTSSTRRRHVCTGSARQARDVERHGTELAGILVGRPRPARGPRRRARRERAPDSCRRLAARRQRRRTRVYSRTDQLIEGLERAVDPNGDGDAHDAARVALVGVAAPYAALRRRSGSARRRTAPWAEHARRHACGKRRPGRPRLRQHLRPGRLAGGADGRRRRPARKTQLVRVSLRSGLQVVLDRNLPLTGELAPTTAFTSSIAAPGLVRTRASFALPGSFFTQDGLSLVAGRAALVPAGQLARGDRPQRCTCRRHGGAALRRPAAGGSASRSTTTPRCRSSRSPPRSPCGFSRRSPAATTRRSRSAPGTTAGTRRRCRVAAFSSTGLAYDGRVKPDVVASGVSIATTEPRPERGRATTYGTVNGSSAAAASVAGAAAVLAEARPELSAAELRSVLVGSARRFPGSFGCERRARGSSRPARPPRPSSSPTQTTLALRQRARRRLEAHARHPRPQRLDASACTCACASSAVRAGRRAGEVPRVSRRASRFRSGDAARTRRRGDQLAPDRRRAGRGQRRARAVRRCSASSSVGGDVRAGRPNASSVRCTSRPIVHAVRRGTRAADVPRRTARHRGGTRLGSAGRAARARPASTATETSSARSQRCATCCPAGTRSASPAATRGQRARQGPLPHPRHRDPESCAVQRARDQVAFTIK